MGRIAQNRRVILKVIFLQWRKMCLAIRNWLVKRKSEISAKIPPSEKQNISLFPEIFNWFHEYFSLEPHYSCTMI